MLHRWSLAIIFIWFGALKLFEYKSATSVIAETIYFGDPALTIRALAIWEIAIGLTLVWRGLIRVALPLLALRLIGTLAAFALKPEVCFANSPLVPTIQGQYLVKDFLLFSAAMVIGGTVRGEHGARR